MDSFFTFILSMIGFVATLLQIGYIIGNRHMGGITLCGRFNLFGDYEEILERFEIADIPIEEGFYTPNYNVAPSQSYCFDYQ